MAIIGGTGALGFGLALRLGVAGVPVRIGSRDAARAAEAAERAAGEVGGGSFDGSTNEEVVRGAPMVVLCVPFRSQAETLKSVAGALEPEAILVDATVPLAVATGGRPTRVLGVPQGSAAQQAAELVPAGVRVVAALHTVSATALAALGRPLDEDILVAGDRRADKRAVAELIESIPGLRAVDVGRLEMARIAESLTALLISVNGRHKVHAGIRLTGLPEQLWAA